MIVVTIVPPLIWACDRVGYRLEDGTLNVEFRYQVVDAESGAPIVGATVEFTEADPPPGGGTRLAMTTDGDGIATRTAPDTGCSLKTSNLGFTNEFVVGEGPWALRVSANHYRPTDRFAPNGREYDWKSEYLGNHKARATIRIPLERSN